MRFLTELFSFYSKRPTDIVVIIENASGFNKAADNWFSRILVKTEQINNSVSFSYIIAWSFWIPAILLSQLRPEFGLMRYSLWHHTGLIQMLTERNDDKGWSQAWPLVNWQLLEVLLEYFRKTNHYTFLNVFLIIKLKIHYVVLLILNPVLYHSQLICTYDSLVQGLLLFDEIITNHTGIVTASVLSYILFSINKFETNKTHLGFRFLIVQFYKIVGIGFVKDTGVPTLCGLFEHTYFGAQVVTCPSTLGYLHN